MVLKKNFDCGTNGFQFSTIPRAPRSVRRRNPHKKKVEDSQNCAFELLASIAGELLHESKSLSSFGGASKGKDKHAFGSSEVIIKHEPHDENKPMETEHADQEGFKESAFIPGRSLQNSNLKRLLGVESNAILDCISVVTSSDCPKKIVNGRKSAIYKKRTNLQNVCGEVENEMERQHRAKGEGSLCRKFTQNASFIRHRSDVNLGSTDDDDKFYRYDKLKSSRTPSHIKDRRIRKLLTSKYWKVSPKLEDCKYSNAGGGVKLLRPKRKPCYSHERCRREVVNKKRKLFNHSLEETSYRGVGTESVATNSPETSMNGHKGVLSAESVSNSPQKGGFHGASAVSCSLMGYQTPIQPKDSNVKFSIKSIRVPELFIEIPETATIGSLKNKIIEAMTNILGGGIHVGVLLQEKKIGDDNRTLLQTGLSSKQNLDELGFTLEPNSMQAGSQLASPESASLLCNAVQHSTRSPATSVLDSVISNAIPNPPLIDSSSPTTSKGESVSPHTDKTTSDSWALVTVPPMSVKALAVVPVDQKTKRSEHRRTRRPFSVSEVEALVQAVEDLGTGRWRDVKLRAFENANHRTYVDLKDKWKTLVHTAQIAPQQRRGEPVPQELLDRVLAGHSYWTQHQAKQHSKNQPVTPTITDMT